MARGEAHVDWKHLVVPAVALAVVVIIGALAIWSFIERQSLVIQPESLPKITVVTKDPNSRLAAAWVRLLTRAEMNPTLVPLETFDPIEGVVVFCDIPQLPERITSNLNEFVRRGGAIVYVGIPPETPFGDLRIAAEMGLSDDELKWSENSTPVLARLNPSEIVQARPMKVALLKESPRMVVDARWARSARAVAIHTEIDGARYLWFGLEPDALGDDRQLMLMLRSAFRWVVGQPVSDGAIGAPQSAKTLTPGARKDARENGFAFSVDRSANPKFFTVRMINRGKVPIANPTVKIWMPPRVTKVALGGDLIMRRSATLTGVPEEGACLVSLPSLGRGEDRVMKLEIIERRPARSIGTAQNARND